MSIGPEFIDRLKHAPEFPGVLEVVLRRWSPRAFSEKPVSSGDLEKVFEAARWAESCFNEQPWRFFLGRRGDPTYQRIFDSLTASNQEWAKSAPVLVLSVAKKNFSSDGHPNRFSLHDTGAATQNLALQATALGFHAHSMAGFDPEKARQSLAIPQDYDIGAITALGYLGSADTLPERLREKELAHRQRKPLQEIVFTEWEQSAQI